MKVTPAIILDVIFTAFTSFFLTLIFIGYFIQGLPLIAISITLSLVFSLFALKILCTRLNKEKLSNADKKAKNYMVNQLNLYTLSEQNNLFEKAVNKLGYTAERKKGGVFIRNENIAIFSKFSFDNVAKTDIVKAFNSAGREDLIYIFCDGFTPEIKSFADRFDGRIILVNAQKVYKFLSQTNCLPKEKFAFPEKKRLSFKAFKNLLKKEQSKRLFFFGLIMLLTSYFVPIKAYYIIFGGIFLFLSLICRLYGTSTPKNA